MEADETAKRRSRPRTGLPHTQWLTGAQGRDKVKQPSVYLRIGPTRAIQRWMIDLESAVLRLILDDQLLKERYYRNVQIPAGPNTEDRPGIFLIARDLGVYGRTKGEMTARAVRKELFSKAAPWECIR